MRCICRFVDYQKYDNARFYITWGNNTLSSTSIILCKPGRFYILLPTFCDNFKNDLFNIYLRYLSMETLLIRRQRDQLH